MATHSSILAWELSRTEELVRLQSMGSHRVGDDCTTTRSCYFFVNSPSEIVSVLICYGKDQIVILYMRLYSFTLQIHSMCPSKLVCPVSQQRLVPGVTVRKLSCCGSIRAKQVSMDDHAFLPLPVSLF